MGVEQKSPSTKPQIAAAQQPAQKSPSQSSAVKIVMPRPRAVLQRAQADPMSLSAAEVDVLQRTIGSRAAQRMLAGQLTHPVSQTDSALQRQPTVQRKLLAPLAGEPTYGDGLTLATIVATAVDKPVLPNLVKPKEIKRWEKTQKKTFDKTDTSFLQNGEIHKASFEYLGLALQLPAGPTYQEYDINKYTFGVGRGGERVVIGTARNGAKTYFYTSDHYQNFAPFTPAA